MQLYMAYTCMHTHTCIQTFYLVHIECVNRQINVSLCFFLGFCVVEIEPYKDNVFFCIWCSAYTTIPHNLFFRLPLKSDLGIIYTQNVIVFSFQIYIVFATTFVSYISIFKSFICNKFI